ncbi:hypothetical protein VTO42DRAFT_3555 [Malbranchea cinnamomea]
MTDVEKGGSLKRAATEDDGGKSSKKRKNAWKQQHHLKNKGGARIEGGDTGVFITCDKGKEKKCAAEVLDLFSQEIANQSESLPETEEKASDSDGGDIDDIEAQIKKEVEGMKPSQSKALFRFINLDIPCLIFIKMHNSLDPVQIVHRLCSDAQANPQNRRCRWIRRLTPITLVQKILGPGLEELAREVLKPHFHSGGPPRKYAIRPTIRNNVTLSRDTVIKTVARMVGPGHSVDLKNYDLLILVDVVQNICGMSVVGSDYDRLKRYNISEIYNPTPRPQSSQGASEAAKNTETSEVAKDAPD